MVKAPYCCDKDMKRALLGVRRREEWNRRESVKRADEVLMKEENWFRKAREG